MQECIDHEEQMLVEWTEGREHGNRPPVGWSVSRQRAFVEGMKYSLDIVSNPEAHQ